MSGSGNSTITRLHTTPDRAHTQLVERVCVPGPASEGDTGDGIPKTTFATPWAASLSWVTLEQERPIITLAKDTGASGWQLQAPLDPPPRVHKAARKLAFCFDQNARPVYAWQAANAIYITQFSVADGEYVTRGPFEGVDPTLYLDAFALRTFVDSDVILFYLHPDRTEVMYRIQRELYANEYALIDLYDERLVEAKYYLDQAIPLSYQYQLALWTKDFGKHYLLSDPYPIVLGNDNLGGQFAPIDLHHFLGAQNAAIESILQGQLTPQLLDYFKQILEYVAEHELQIKAQPQELHYFVQLLAAVIETRLELRAAPILLHHEEILAPYKYEEGIIGTFSPTLLDYLMIQAFELALESKLKVTFAPDVMSYFANLLERDLDSESVNAHFAPDLIAYRNVTVPSEQVHDLNLSGKPNDLHHYNVTVPTQQSTGLGGHFLPSLLDYWQVSFPSGPDANTVLLIESNGEVEGSTNFVDLSGNDYGLTRQGNVTHSLNVGGPPGLGSSSIRIKDIGHLETIDNFPTIFGSDFTIECWAYRDGSGQSFLFGQTSVSSRFTPLWFRRSGSRNSFAYEYSYNGDFERPSTRSQAVFQTWQHIALELEGTALRTYLDGMLIDTHTVSLFTTGDGLTITIGTAIESGDQWDGYIQQFRLSNVARYQGANFTPPDTFLG